jgi:O-antigen/teichoic acid export membrane protein
MLQREWPVNVLRRQENRGVVLAAQCQIVAVACAAVAILAAAFLGVSPAGYPSTLLVAGLLHGLSQQMFLVATLDSRSRGNSMAFARQNLARAIGSLIVGIGAALLTQSAVIVLLTEALLSIGLSARLQQRTSSRSKLPFLAIQRLALRRLTSLNWRSALVLLAITAVSFLMLNVDRWVAAASLGAEKFAHYSFAWILLIVAQSVQAVANASIYPVLARRAASDGVQSAFRLCAAVAVFTVALGVICYLPFIALGGFAIRRWFPLYSDTLSLLSLFYLVGMMRASDFWSSYLLVIGRESALLIVNVVVVIVGAVSWNLVFESGAVTVEPYHVAILALGLSSLGYTSALLLAWIFRKPAGVGTRK